MKPDDFRQTRKALGWTQAALAEALGITPRAVRRYEAGERRIPAMAERLLVLIQHHRACSQAVDTR